MNSTEEHADYDLSQQHHATRRIVQRKMLFTSIFLLGTVLAAIGWAIEIKGLDQVSAKFARLVVLALIGHVLQVIGAFGNLVTPDENEGEN